MPILFLAVLILVSGTLNIRATYRGFQKQVYLFKLLAMGFVLILAWMLQMQHPSVYGYWVIAGLLCAVIGDVFLMLPADRFLPGLMSFWVAHILYIFAFSMQVDSLSWGYGVVGFIRRRSGEPC